MTGVIQPYAWGSTTVIPDLLGVEPDGTPQAELWLGAHPLAPAVVDGTSLDDLVDADPERIVGAAAVARFGPRLPFLVKVLAADQPLSLQAHPSREQEAGVPRDAPQRIYRDGWPKPEVLCALTETEALCGFRDPDEAADLFDRLGVPVVQPVVAPLRGPGTPGERLREVFGRLLRLPAGERSVVAEVVDAAAARAGEPGLDLVARTATELAVHHPGDPGVLAALLMNRITLQPDEALFLPAGNLHAYLRGAGVEIMANSDNVMRGGLTPKHVDVDELLAVLEFEPVRPAPLACAEEAPGVWHYEAPAPEFALWRLRAEAARLAVPGLGSGRVLLVTEGCLDAVADGERLALRRGEAAFVDSRTAVTVAGTGTLFVGGAGV